MYKEKISYFEPGYPFILVKKITREIVEETIQAYVEKNDGYWLRFYHFADEIDKSVFDSLQTEHLQKLKKFKELEKLDELEDS